MITKCIVNGHSKFGSKVWNHTQLIVAEKKLNKGFADAIRRPFYHIIFAKRTYHTFEKKPLC